MLDIKFIRENPEKVKEACQKKGVTCDVDAFLDVDAKKRKMMVITEELRAKQNKVTKDNIEEGKRLKEEIKKLQPEFDEITAQWEKMLYQFPNIPFDDVPVGKDDSENVVVRQVGKAPKFSFQPKDHIQLGKELGIIDIESAAVASGARFYYLKNEGALLERALVDFAFDVLKKKGFMPVIPPVMLNEQAARGTGYFDNDNDKQEAYFLPEDKLYLTGTSEQSVLAMNMKKTLELKTPERYVAFSTCFRRESGSYGKDTKGILRVHQFDKVEMVIFSKPEDAQKEHELILSVEEDLMKNLGLPYQVVNICTGDLGKPAAKKYDIETWMPGQNRYRETHSTSNCTDYQARRLEIKYKDKTSTLQYVHTLNGTAFAIGRVIIAILENLQQKDGSVKIPRVLHKYAGFKVIHPVKYRTTGIFHGKII